MSTGTNTFTYSQSQPRSSRSRTRPNPRNISIPTPVSFHTNPPSTSNSHRNSRYSPSQPYPPPPQQQIHPTSPSNQSNYSHNSTTSNSKTHTQQNRNLCSSAENSDADVDINIDIDTPIAQRTRSRSRYLLPQTEKSNSISETQFVKRKRSRSRSRNSSRSVSSASSSSLSGASVSVSCESSKGSIDLKESCQNLSANTSVSPKKKMRKRGSDSKSSSHSLRDVVKDEIDRTSNHSNRSNRSSQHQELLNQNAVEPLEEVELEDCGICFDAVTDRGRLDCCAHTFCFMCVDKWVERASSCPHCKREVQYILRCDASGETITGVKNVSKRTLRDTLDREEYNNYANLNNLNNLGNFNNLNNVANLRFQAMNANANLRNSNNGTNGGQRGNGNVNLNANAMATANANMRQVNDYMRVFFGNDLGQGHSSNEPNQGRAFLLTQMDVFNRYLNLLPVAWRGNLPGISMQNSSNGFDQRFIDMGNHVLQAVSRNMETGNVSVENVVNQNAHGINNLNGTGNVGSIGISNGNVTATTSGNSTGGFNMNMNMNLNMQQLPFGSTTFPVPMAPMNVNFPFNMNLNGPFAMSGQVAGSMNGMENALFTPNGFVNNMMQNLVQSENLVQYVHQQITQAQMILQQQLQARNLHNQIQSQYNTSAFGMAQAPNANLFQVATNGLNSNSSVNVSIAGVPVFTNTFVSTVPGNGIQAPLQNAQLQQNQFHNNIRQNVTNNNNYFVNPMHAVNENHDVTTSVGTLGINNVQLPGYAVVDNNTYVNPTQSVMTSNGFGAPTINVGPTLSNNNINIPLQRSMPSNLPSNSRLMNSQTQSSNQSSNLNLNATQGWRSGQSRWQQRDS